MFLVFSWKYLPQINLLFVFWNCRSKINQNEKKLLDLFQEIYKCLGEKKMQQELSKDYENVMNAASWII